MIYKELIQGPQENKRLARKLAGWLARLQSSNKPQRNNTDIATRIASDAATWFRNGLAGCCFGFEKRQTDICMITCLFFVHIIFQTLAMRILVVETSRS
jgi:hypothetical protein